MIERIAVSGTTPDPNATQAGSTQVGADGRPVGTGVAVAAPNGQLAGKFANVQELESGYVNLFGQTQAIQQDNASLKTRVDALTSILENVNGAGGGQRQAQSVQAQSKVAELAEQLNVSQDLVFGALREVALPAAQEVFAPIGGAMTAQQTLAQRRPDYAAKLPAVAQFLKTRPELEAGVQAAVQTGKPELISMAYDAAYLAHDEYQRLTGANNATSRVSASGADQLTARLDAQSPNAGASLERQASVDPTGTGRAQKLAHYASAAADGRTIRGAALDDLLRTFLNDGGHVPEGHVR